MVLIVASHFACHGVQQILWLNSPNADIWKTGLVINKAILAFLNNGGIVGVGLFFMLTGYFMVESRAKPFKLLKLVLQLFFYAVFALFIYVVSTKLNLHSFFELDSQRRIPAIISCLARCVLPVSCGGWWFATAYFFLYLFSPVLNYVINRLNKKGMWLLIAVVFVFWYAPYVFGFAYSDLKRGIFFYLLGAYFRLHKPNISKTNSIIFVVILYFLMTALGFYTAQATAETTILKLFLLCLKGINPVVLCPIVVFLLFSFFSNLHFKSRFINIVASTTFGIYLLHDSQVGRAFIWNVIVRPIRWMNSYLFVFYAFIAIFAVFCVCSAIDYARIMLVEKPLIPRVKSVYEKIKLMCLQ